ncbi:hypothetical protein BCR42DRAFT_417185 [Absidia repens]|uniref:F-box domain-containing protein n=1 Tax=Absidia repens TaxID=90262 RepID=A0A1X2IDW6_9FUNG|nr:hypothetical protein BCR42DRAFT_417185 [Absidia repens]
MVQLSSLPESILLQVVYHLSLQELQQLAQTCRPLRELVYNSPRVWHQHVLFPANDTLITDRFIQHFVPHITRHHGIQTLRLERLPLGWLGYLFIFDQFAHSVDYIHVETSFVILQDLVYHLTVFAANLMVLQQDNMIPITFRQYGLDASSYYQVLVDHQFLGKTNLAHITQLINKNNSGNSIRNGTGGGGDDDSYLSNLDDPPFENLQHWAAVCTDHPPPDQKQDQDKDQQDSVVRNCISQLDSLISFLAGRQVTNPGTHTTAPSVSLSPITATTTGTTTTNTNTTTTTNITGYKRTQDHLDTSGRQKQKLVSSASHTSSLYV